MMALAQIVAETGAGTAAVGVTIALAVIGGVGGLLKLSKNGTDKRLAVLEGHSVYVERELKSQSAKIDALGDKVEAARVAAASTQAAVRTLVRLQGGGGTNE